MALAPPPGGGAIAILILGALVIGVALQLIADTTTGWEWVAGSIGAFVGGCVGSESLGAVSTYGPAVQDLYVVPALIGALLVSAVVDFAVRSATGGTYVSQPHAA